MQAFLDKHFYKGIDLRRARNYAGMERHELAELFGTSKHYVKQMETNTKPLTQEAIDFIRVMGHAKKVPLKKLKKRASEGKCIDKPKNIKIPPEKIIKKQQVSDLIRCSVCNEAKYDWELNMECISPYRITYICDECIASEKEEANANIEEIYELPKAA
jgi:hypothetical protein